MDDAASVTGADGTACTLEYDPVYCQGCEFDSSCIASSFGFDVAVDCVSIATPETRDASAADEQGGDDVDDPADDPTSGSNKKQTLTMLVAVMTLLSYLA